MRQNTHRWPCNQNGKRKNHKLQAEQKKRPIPGTKRLRYLEENMKAMTVQLTPNDLQETDARLQQTSVEGERYTPEMMALVHG